MARKPSLTCYTLTLNSDAIARAFQVSPEDAASVMMDGRNIAKWAEHWGKIIYRYVMHPNSNNPYDASVDLGPLANVHTCVRVLTTRIKFQRSAEMGAGRRATTESLQQTLEEFEYYIICDNQQYPAIRFVVLDTKYLLRLIREGRLTINGLKYTTFYSLLEADFDVQECEFKIPEPTL